LPKLPVVSSSDLVRVLEKLDYSFVHQRGSHIKMVKETNSGKHMIIIPLRKEQKRSTLNNILNDIVDHNDITKEDLIALFR